MTTTGLVSINVHEALSFDGTPICLHPDLFTPIGEAPSFHTNGSVSTAVAANRLPVGVKALTNTPKIPSEEKTSDSVSLVSESKPLQVGDMVEIRVWDPLPRTSALNVSSIMRQRSFPNTHTVSYPVSVTSSTSSAIGSCSDVLRVDKPALEASRISSLQKSESSMEKGSVIAQESAFADSSTSSDDHRNLAPAISEGYLPVKSDSTGEHLPPIVPRGRSDTADANVQRSFQPKPPLQRRSTTSTVNLRQPVGVKSRHVRDLSDMTAETLYGSSTPVENGDLQMSADEDDEIWPSFSHTHSLRMSFIMLITEKSLTSLRSARTQVSILRQVADLYQVSSYDMVSVHRVSKDEERDAVKAVSADFVLVTIKDQFISRGDMLLFQESLMGSWIYEGQRLYEPSRGLQANAKEIRHAKQQALSGIITEKTTFTYRSRSARIVWLVQISAEMWDYGSPYERGQEESLCEIYFDKWISFVHKLFAKWKELEATHSLTVVFFGRSFVGSTSIMKDSKTTCDAYGRHFEDHFRIVLENEIGPDWEPLIVKIKEAFKAYPTEIGWTLGENARRPSTASQGNLLEAVNVTLNLLQNHYLDRDLQRTGNSIVVVSAGNGVFEVDKGLAGITYQRMMDNGIGSDMLSIGRPALHIAPFFLYVNVFESAEMEDADAQEHYYEVPHWMHLSFVSYESDHSVFIDHLHESDIKKSNRSQKPSDTGLEIFPHGFLAHRSKDVSNVEIQSSPILLPTSFSVRGNAAASPVRNTKEVSNGRQLIAGRDFRDILEACKPRHAGIFPSALAALLRTESKPDIISSPADLLREHADVYCLKEWGILNFEGTQQRTSHRCTESPSRISSTESLVKSRPDSESDQCDELSSHQSSFASQLSSSVLGMSYDRSYVKQNGPGATAITLQRSPSLELDFLEETPVDGNEAGGSDTGWNSPPRKKGESLKNHLLALMRLADKSVLQVSSPKITRKLEPTRKTSEIHKPNPASQKIKGATIVQGPFHKSQGLTSGGLGAALTQYRSTPSAGVLSEHEPGRSKMSRISSVGRISSGGTSVFHKSTDTGGLNLSPLLLPPVAVGLSEPFDRFAEGMLPPQNTFERRILRPSDFSSRSPGLLGSKKIELATHTKKELEQASRSLSISPPLGRNFGRSPAFRREQQVPPSSHKARTRNRVSASALPSRHGLGSRKKKAFNPFRQQDEVEVLATKSHNRRRWSHVFPLGEVEFKRHAGPNWKSLTAPAILPLDIDYFPSSLSNFTSSFYNVTLSEFEKRNFTSNKDLLDEMVRQRLTQDFQLVPQDCVDASNLQREMRLTRGGLVDPDEAASSDSISQYLSMGHRLQVLTYNASADLIAVTRYDAKHAQKSFISQYQYFSYCQEKGAYTSVKQTFSKFSTQYNWNKVDRLICGDEDREMREGMRFKRLMFGILPESIDKDHDAEEVYIKKFERLLEYFEKLREQDDSCEPLGVKIVRNTGKPKEKQSEDMGTSIPGLGLNSMIRFYVQLRKGKRDSLEYVEIAVDCTFNTTWSYRIMFSWLVASSGKIDAQIQLLLRRCTQYGLTIVPFPHISVSKSMYLNPFKAPAIFTVKDKELGQKLDALLLGIDYIHDGVFYTDVKSILNCIEHGMDFNFGKGWSATSITGRQYVHRSGTLFVRLLTDRNGFTIAIVLGNYRFIFLNKINATRITYQAAFKALETSVSALLENNQNDRNGASKA